MQVNEIFLDRYHITALLGSGGFGNVYKAYDLKSNQEFAIKIDVKKRNQTLVESKILLDLQGGEGIPKLHTAGKYADLSYMITELLGPNLNTLREDRGKKFQLNSVVTIGCQALDRLEYIHSKGYCHKDVKPSQFLLSLDKKKIYVCDFGLSCKYIYGNSHIPFRGHCSRVGSPSFASLNLHLGFQCSRRDDLESLSYMLILMLKGSLPWNQNKFEYAEKWQSIYGVKARMSISSLCSGCPAEIEKFLSYTRELKFEEKPDYRYLKSLLISAATVDYAPEYLEWINLDELIEIKKKSKKHHRNKSFAHGEKESEENGSFGSISSSQKRSRRKNIKNKTLILKHNEGLKEGIRKVSTVSRLDKTAENSSNEKNKNSSGELGLIVLHKVKISMHRKMGSEENPNECPQITPSEPIIRRMMSGLHEIDMSTTTQIPQVDELTPKSGLPQLLDRKILKDAKEKFQETEIAPKIIYNNYPITRKDENDVSRNNVSCEKCIIY
ncbi:unnamed protein product [Blepharisma stoltei]|uniref:Casein kinase I n=1 Tax=Blepharisma stoltei TaxID=1481888 RepID=A0AAU9JP79_9CILI|nr:unnamed protein product [Blepharisma stoltei]